MAQLAWDSPAQEALRGVPFFVRALARRKVEEQVAAQGRDRVTLEDFAQAQARFKAVMAGKSQAELQTMLPTQNQPGVEMVILEACRSELAACPNQLLAVEPWRQALQDWIAQSDLSERLRARVGEDQVLYHHKLRIAISGCPNGCSRPQIADLALVGTLRPSFDPELCTGCAACAQACPDQALAVTLPPPLWDAQACQGCLQCRDACPAGAVNLSQPQARLLMGGKLGRHPRLAREVALLDNPRQAIAHMQQALDRYLAQAEPGERFASWFARRVEEGKR